MLEYSFVVLMYLFQIDDLTLNSLKTSIIYDLIGSNQIVTYYFLIEIIIRYTRVTVSFRNWNQIRFVGR